MPSDYPPKLKDPEFWTGRGCVLVGMLLVVLGVAAAAIFAIVVGVGVTLRTMADTMLPESPSVPLSPLTATDRPLNLTALPVSTPPPCTAVGETWTRPADGMEMVCVPAGEFLMGSPDDDPDADDDEKPQHTVYLDAFWIDRTEVTNAQYRQCVDTGACWESECWEEDDLNAPDQPVVCVKWHDAQAYAEWVGGTLPTEAEWEKAARGTDGRIYPWGNSSPDCDRANYVGCAAQPLSVGSHPDGASPYGALDMAGNVREWVADWYDADYYCQSPLRNPQGPESGSFRVRRGGSFLDYQGNVRCAFREGGYPINWHWIFGFRVVVAPGDHEP